ncbi:MAG: hypothetical protein ACRDSP_14685 [Pseudonocardiaceae bacterium]
MLPRRFHSSALRVCGAGRLATGSYPQFVVIVNDATSAWGVALNIALTLHGLADHTHLVEARSSTRANRQLKPPLPAPDRHTYHSRPHSMPDAVETCDRRLGHHVQ